MIHSLKINGYRGFSRFEMTGLGTVNLLVGRNNSGKTSVLEGLYLLASGGEPYSLWRILSRRGERIENDEAGRSSELEYDISSLFHASPAVAGANFSFSIRNGQPDRSLIFRLDEPSAEEQLRFDDSDRPTHLELIEPRLNLVVEGSPRPVAAILPLSKRGGLSSDSIDRSRRFRRASVAQTQARPAQLVTTESLSVSELTKMWNDIVLTDGEELVLSALRFLEPKIDRIAAMTTTPYSFANERGGFKIKVRDRDMPFPIGSLGDGTWRMLALAIALVRSKGGVLLIDEIDTGLHYTVMTDMWRFIYKTAKQFGVQIFATTHSYDCIQSLATLCIEDKSTHEDITIQRIEKGNKFSVPFSAAEIKKASELRIEMR